MTTYRPESHSVEADFRCRQKQIRILVVDDDDFTRKIILTVLRDLGHSDVVDTASAESAITVFESGSFDLIITDVNMPGMNGLQFIQMIRSGKTHAEPSTRIMVATIFSQTEILGTALALDVNGFLVKPIVPDVVERKLAQAMTEPFRPRAPITYEAIKTEPKALEIMSSKALGRVNVAQMEGKVKKSEHGGHQLLLSGLRPGMVVAENIYLKNGALFLSAGHDLSDMTINRLNDLESFLQSSKIVIQ
ncbi:MAG: response regulator [Gammaproteobacteria bacterium]|nr:response regulator [Gammaproteobacteria bacterium]